jgi:hypothetical protein
MGSPPYRRKLQTYLDLREDLERRCPGAEYFDLRFRDRIFVKQPNEIPPPAPVPSSVPAEKAGPENAVIPQDRSPQNPSPAPDPVPPVPPVVPGDADAGPPADTPEVVTG